VYPQAMKNERPDFVEEACRLVKMIVPEPSLCSRCCVQPQQRTAPEVRAVPLLSANAGRSETFLGTDP
jgi:hypothetical protein